MFSKKIPLDQKFHRKAMHLFKEYFLVGGMPQAIVAFASHGRDFAAADIEKRDILDLYRDDIKKSARKYNSRVSAIFENIPSYQKVILIVVKFR